MRRGETGASPSDAIAMVILLCDAIIVASPLVQHVTTKTLVRGFQKSVFSDKKSAAECILAQPRLAGATCNTNLASKSGPLQLRVLGDHRWEDVDS